MAIKKAKPVKKAVAKKVILKKPAPKTVKKTVKKVIAKKEVKIKKEIPAKPVVPKKPAAVVVNQPHFPITRPQKGSKRDKVLTGEGWKREMMRMTGRVLKK